MAIEFRCSQCNQLLRVSDQSAGKSARCPKCQTTLKVPGEATAANQPTGASAAPTNDPFGFSPAPQGGSPFPTTPAAGGFGGGAPPKPDPYAPAGFGGGTASNPFGEAKPLGGSTALGVNPYASPAASASFAPGLMTSPYGVRPGLPWEQQGGSLGTWWETAKLCMLSPTHAFSIMRTEGGIGSPMMYGLLGQMIGAAAAAFWQVVLIVGMMAIAGGGGAGGEAVGGLALQLVGQLLYIFIMTAIGATVGMLVTAGIIHVFLLMVGAGNRGYEATFRTLVFGGGSLAWMQVIPIIGGMIAGIWILVIDVIGLSKAHDADIGKVILAIVLAIVAGIFICALPFVLLFFFIGAAIAGAGAGGGLGN